MTHTVPVMIIGGGPIGLEMGVALRRRGIDFQIIEAGSLGHTMSWWAPQTRWFSSNERISIAGVPLMTMDGSKATREEYLMYLRGVATQFDLPIRSHEKVSSVNPLESGGFSVVGAMATTCEKVVMAVGGTDFPRKLNVPGESLPHVDGYLREPHRYYGRRVLIIGGRNSAVEAALRLHHAGAHVEICYRGASLPVESIKYWLTPEILGLIDAGRVVAHLGTQPVSISSTHVSVETLGSHDIYDIAADDVLSLIGYEQDKSLFRDAGVELIGQAQQPKHDVKTMETNVPGIYVAGTAAAGTQSSSYKTFLENCHQHIDKIVAHMTGDELDQSAMPYVKQTESQPES